MLLVIAEQQPFLSVLPQFFRSVGAVVRKMFILSLGVVFIVVPIDTAHRCFFRETYRWN